MLFARLERAADIVVCTPVDCTKQLPCTVSDSAAQSGWTCSRAPWTGSDLRSYSDWSRAQDAHHVCRSVWTRLPASHRAFQSRLVMTPYWCLNVRLVLILVKELNCAKPRSCFYKIFMMHGQKITWKRAVWQNNILLSEKITSVADKIAHVV